MKQRTKFIRQLGILLFICMLCCSCTSLIHSEAHGEPKLETEISMPVEETTENTTDESSSDLVVHNHRLVKYSKHILSKINNLLELEITKRITPEESSIDNPDETTDAETEPIETTVEESTVVVHEHNYTKSVKVAATCDNDGVMEYACSCGQRYTEPIKATGHNFKHTIVDPTYDNE